MAQATVDNNTRRRDFLALTAAVATAAMAARPALASPPDDSALLALEEQIFEQYELATAYHDEICRLSDIWQAESKRLYEEALSRELQTGKYLTPEERWDLVTAMPECIEHNRLCKLQDVHLCEDGRPGKGRCGRYPRKPRRGAGPRSWWRSACCLTAGE